MNNVNFPRQTLSFDKKNAKWRKSVMDWADSKTFFNYSLCRKSVVHKKINYDLLQGKLHMNDLEMIINPESIKAGFVPDKIQHYPIINSKIHLLKGEESKRLFDWRAVITNPNAISEIEEIKKQKIYERLQQWISNKSQSEEEAAQELEKINYYFTYQYQDFREIRANALLSHYIKELNIPLIFNEGFGDALAVGEEIYQCDIEGGEPTLRRLNPLKVRIFKSGYSNKIEDADIIILEDYWSPGRVIDAYYDVLTKKDIDYIEKLPNTIGQTSVDSMDNIDERFGFINNNMVGEELTSREGFFWDPMLTQEGVGSSLLPYDLQGNLRVLRVYWKSKRRIKKVKSYDSETGEEVYNFYPENYVLDTNMGEEEQIFYINEAWEGTKIGTDIYVNMRPRVVQYNRMSNPSRCHFGIIGSLYNMNDSRPFSFVDLMKPYSYYYDVIHDRLNKLIARNWGTILKLDLSRKPNGWDVDKWIYYAKTMGLAVEDSFNEGLEGASLGRIAGSLNSPSSGIIAASDGNQIQQYINLLEFIKMEMGEVVGITKQREGQISNRETVGGVERATLQSSHITEQLYVIHEDVKRRVFEALVETAKAAIKGGSKKFPYILSDGSKTLMEIDGDEFAECDYGIVVDNSNGVQDLNQKLDMLAQAALQNQKLSFSTIMKLYGSASLVEKQRMVEKDEQDIQARIDKAAQEQNVIAKQQVQAEMQLEEAKLKQQDILNQRDNETKIIIAQMGAEDSLEEMSQEGSKSELLEKMREFDKRLQLDYEKLSFDKQKALMDADLKRQQISKSNKTSKK